MFQTIDVPLWALVLLVVLAAWAALDRLLVPSARWFLRRKVDRVLEDVGQHLRIKIEPFRLTKLAVLIDRLVYDPEVMKAAATTAGFLAHNLWQMALGRWHRFGYVCVNFGTPVSMRAYCRERSLRPAELTNEERFTAVGRVADHLMESLAGVIPVVPVPFVATVFQRSNAPLSELELKAEAQRLMADLEARGARIYIPRSDREYAIEVGLRMLTLRHVVVERDGLYTAAPEEDRLLAYYANSIAHLLRGGQPAASTPW